MTATVLTRGAAALAVASVLALTGCSGSSSDDSGGGSSAAEVAAAPEAADDSGGSTAARGVADTAAVEQSLIATGTVELRSRDVAAATDEVRAVVDRYQGTLDEDSARTDDDGEARSARLVLRVPTSSFDEAMADLKGVGTLVAADSSVDDVTTQVLDIDVRVEAQKRSIERIQVLFDQATTIKDVVSIEGELSARQADLASLEQQQAYLADQTAQATITVSLQRPSAADTPEDEDDAGFLAGLSAGWAGLSAFAVGLATVAGAVLPFAVVLLVLAALVWPLVRRARRRPRTAAARG